MTLCFEITFECRFNEYISKFTNFNFTIINIIYILIIILLRFEGVFFPTIPHLIFVITLISLCVILFHMFIIYSYYVNIYYLTWFIYVSKLTIFFFYIYIFKKINIKFFYVYYLRKLVILIKQYSTLVFDIIE